jgi:hypothetical protein
VLSFDVVRRARPGALSRVDSLAAFVALTCATAACGASSGSTARSDAGGSGVGSASGGNAGSTFAGAGFGGVSASAGEAGSVAGGQGGSNGGYGGTLGGMAGVPGAAACAGYGVEHARPCAEGTACLGTPSASGDAPTCDCVADQWRCHWSMCPNLCLSSAVCPTGELPDGCTCTVLPPTQGQFIGGCCCG